jgi:hypothetical protein
VKETKRTLVSMLGVLLLSIGFIGIAGAQTPPAGTATAQPGGMMLYGSTASNRLVSFSSTAPGTLMTNVAITGLQGGENVVGIDFRPATGQLLALGSTSRIYTLDVSTGAATQIGTNVFTTTLNGTEFGFDFNPTVDRIRVTSDS